MPLLTQVPTGNRSPETRARRARERSSESALYLSKYISVYVWTYAGLCRDRRRHVRLHLNGDLCLDWYPESHAALNRASLQKPFEKPNPTLFRWPYGLKYRLLYDLVNLAVYRQTQPPGRPLGR